MQREDEILEKDGYIYYYYYYIFVLFQWQGEQAKQEQFKKASWFKGEDVWHALVKNPHCFQQGVIAEFGGLYEKAKLTLKLEILYLRTNFLFVHVITSLNASFTKLKMWTSCKRGL